MAKDPSINSLKPNEDSRGRGFLPLLGFGLTKEVLLVLLDMAKMTVIMEAYLQHTLINPSLVSLSSKRNEIHHSLLSLPPLEKSSSSTLYECCRLAALSYATAALFALPPSTGIPRQLILQIQSEIEDFCLEGLCRFEANFYIWVLVLAGIWAEGMPERLWFINRLRELLASEGVFSWNKLKSIIVPFLWMSSVCDEGGMNLWNDVVSGPSKPTA
jgi:hypothetical protein